MRKFFGGIYGSSFFGGILWGNSSGIVNNCSNFQMLTGFLHFQSQPIFYILNKKLFGYGSNLFVCQDSDFCQDFVSIKEGRRTNLDP